MEHLQFRNHTQQRRWNYHVHKHIAAREWDNTVALSHNIIWGKLIKHRA